jgi:type IV pilus assembly protein PilP
MSLVKQRLYSPILLTLCLSSLVACVSDEMTDLEKKIADIKAVPKTGIDPLPPTKVTEPFSFSLDGSRDPFESEENTEVNPPPETTPEGPQPDPTRPKEELEGYALENLKMVGTLKDVGKSGILWGLVQSNDTPHATIHRIQVGNYIGRNDGHITEITANEIKLIELIPQETTPKTWQEKPTSLKMILID